MQLRGMLVRPRILGTVVRVSELERCISDLSDAWLSNQHTSADGSHVGWYRVLNRSERIGTYATAQGMVALTASGAPVPQLELTVRTLLDARIPGKGWAFVSTLTDRTVIDATAWVLIALSPYRHEPLLSDLHLPQVLDEVAGVLESMAMPTGGWGLTADGPYRAHSTALAIRGLCADGRERSNAVQAGVQALNRTVDPDTGHTFVGGNQHNRLPPVTACVVDLPRGQRNRATDRLTDVGVGASLRSQHTDLQNPVVDAYHRRRHRCSSGRWRSRTVGRTGCHRHHQAGHRERRGEHGLGTTHARILGPAAAGVLDGVWLRTVQCLSDNRRQQRLE